MNPHTQKLEQIIVDMKLGDHKPSGREYQQWLEFLRTIHPESQLLKMKIITKQLTDIREIMILAEAASYPTWYIQPKFTGAVVHAKYSEGRLQSMVSKQQTLDTSDIEGLPPNIPEFTGNIKGILNEKFIAFDIDTQMSFLQKMQFFKDSGVAAADYVAFPTSKIPSISSTSLETMFQNYIRQAHASLQVDGLVIISDTPLYEGATQYNRMVYKWNSNSEKVF